MCKYRNADVNLNILKCSNTKNAQNTDSYHF